MTEDIIFKRRNRLKKHFINTSNVLLYGYKTLSDAAKVTFQVIDGFDWEDAQTEDSKGYVFPSIKTIAEIRNTSERTVFRHIKELEGVKLLTRIRQRYKPSILYIEDISEEEGAAYLARFVDKVKSTQENHGTEISVPSKETAIAAQSRTDKNGSSHKAPELTKMAVLDVYMKEKEKKENEINVNENFNISDNKKRSGMQGVGDIMRRFDTVSKNRPPERPNARMHQNRKTGRVKNPEEKAKRDYFATHIATELADEKSLGCYRVIAEAVPQSVIFETLGAVKETWKEGKIQKSRGALFVDIIKNYCNKNHIALPFSERAA